MPEATYAPESQQRAAASIWEARRRNRPVGALDDTARPPSIDDGYRVQRAVHRRILDDGAAPLAGYKVGCTSPVMQRYLAIDAPCAGGIFATGVHTSPASLVRRDYVRLGVECELAVRLTDPLPELRHIVADPGVAVAEIMAAVELVDDRYEDYASLGAPTLIADDFFGAGCVLGTPEARWHDLDLAGIEGRMTVNGTVTGTGAGRDLLGHPLNVLAWLAELLARQERPLAGGQIVLLGSLVKTVWISAGDRVAVEIGPLAPVHLSLA